MEQITIIIPSHLRAEKVSTTNIVSGGVLCVAEAQADAYRNAHPNTEIIAHPNNVIGLPPKLEWIRKNVGGNLFYLDDDVKSFTRLYTEKGEPAKVDDPCMVREIIEKTAWQARQAKAYLFGFNHSPMPQSYSGHKPIEMSGFIMGGATGLLGGSKLYWNEDMKIGGDMWISCLNAYYHRRIFKDMRYAFTFKDTFVNEGGLSEFRNIEREKEKYDILKRFFGNAIQPKKDTRFAKRKHPYMITMDLPF